ncbi:mobility group protein 1B-like [Drosophila madeirensis]|uniref:Mobility group protein 1B-like n=1 Tax=Drosophila madeirensis TaxID=30013 RepID=A0AAU9F9N7_DROMD
MESSRCPKRPLNAYVMWMNCSGRRIIKKKHPQYSFTQVARKSSRLWSKMCEYDKSMWHTYASVAMIQYKARLGIWKSQQAQTKSSTVSHSHSSSDTAGSHQQ